MSTSHARQKLRRICSYYSHMVPEDISINGTHYYFIRTMLCHFVILVLLAGHFGRSFWSAVLVGNLGRQSWSVAMASSANERTQSDKQQILYSNE